MRSRMHLIQVLLPLYDNDGNAIERSRFRAVSEELTQQFGGLTAYTRAPAEGLWKDDASSTTRDEMVLFEVMTETLDRDWWATYRQSLEQRFRQKSIVVRAQETSLL
jgi:hypothetical protein